MKSPRSPFAKFEAALAAERRAERRPLEPGEIIDRRTAPRRRKESRTKRLEFAVDPMVTANAALHAVKNGTTTNKVLQGWIEELSKNGNPPDLDPGIKLILQIAIGPNGIPVELAREVNEMARREGMDPGELCGLFLRIGLHKEREKRAGEVSK